MIAASVRLYHPAPELTKFIDEKPITRWLLDNVGDFIRYTDYVAKEWSWCVQHEDYYIDYYFAREEDAVMFALRWS